MKVAVGFNHLTKSQVSALLECDHCISVNDGFSALSKNFCRQRLTYISDPRNRHVEPFEYSHDVEVLLRRFRSSKEFARLYDMVRRLGSRAFMGAGLSASPLEIDFSRSYLEWWTAKNIFSHPVGEVVFAYHPHSPFDLTLYYMARWHSLNVLSAKNFYSTPFYILSKNILDDGSYDLLDRALPVDKRYSDEQKAIVRSHIEHARYVVYGQYEWKHAKDLEASRLARTSFRRLLRIVKNNAKSGKIKYKNSACNRPVFAPNYDSVMGRGISLLSRKYKGLEDKIFSGVGHAEMAGYAFFSLQTQPEATTEIFGGSYIDQLEMLRELRCLLDPEISIIVRDHRLFSTPQAYSRPRDWVEVIKKLPNTHFAPACSHNGELIKRALVVCSVSGTCCLEANVVGVPALYGGYSEFLRTSLSRHISEFDSMNDFMEWIRLVSSGRGDRDSQFAEELTDSMYPFVRYGSPYKKPSQFFGVPESDHDPKFIEWYKA